MPKAMVATFRKPIFPSESARSSASRLLPPSRLRRALQESGLDFQTDGGLFPARGMNSWLGKLRRGCYNLGFLKEPGRLSSSVVKRLSSPTVTGFVGDMSTMRRGPAARKTSKKRTRVRTKTKKKDPLFVEGKRPRPMYVDYKDVELLSKLINRHGRIVGRRKTGCSAISQHAVTQAIKRARFMALLPYVAD